MKMRMVIVRNGESTRQTEGYLFIFKGIRLAFQCAVLELGDNHNRRSVSRIPAGAYQVKKHQSPKFGAALWVLDVPGRSEILFHWGNYNMDTRGCILPGRHFVDMNKDGDVDVTDSRRTMGELLHHCDTDFQLNIIDEPIYN